MTVEYRKSLAIIGSAFLTLFVLAPSHAATTQNSSVVASVETMGTINVINSVINDNLGTKLHSDFIFTVKHWGTEVVGSPFAGANGSGVSFVLKPGSYVVSTPVIDGYLGSWSGVGIENGFILLQAGQVVTITRTSEDVGPFGPYDTYVPIYNPTTEDDGSTPTTVDGGTLPKTSSPWFNVMAAGLLLSVAGAFGLRKSRMSNYAGVETLQMSANLGEQFLHELGLSVRSKAKSVITQPKIGEVKGTFSIPRLKRGLPNIETTGSNELKLGVGPYI